MEGATDSKKQATTIRQHLDNHLAWLSMLQELPDLSGMILTGLARYDHYATLCGLLPASLLSFCCCLAILSLTGLSQAVLGQRGPAREHHVGTLQVPTWDGAQVSHLPRLLRVQPGAGLHQADCM